MKPHLRTCIWAAALLILASAWPAAAEEGSLREQLDAPLLFVKRHSYTGIHIYDTYYQWNPGGGIYIIENPGDPPGEHRVRPVIDAHTPETLGEGIYSDPDLSWDATRILFNFKGEESGSTAIYEIGIDGQGLRMLSNPLECASSCGRFANQHDVCPAYLPDGRIVFKSTRPNGLVPCNNTGVDILHIMDADGGNVRRLSVNNVNEFDPCVMPDGRILHGRWEYVDKTALTQQSLWTIFPDGSFETALYANNLVRPEAFLDARPIPGAPHLIVATFARHNSTPRGSIGIVDTRVSKNDPAALFNFDYPDDPTNDTGDSCEPWPLDDQVILFSGRPAGAGRNVIEIRDRSGRRELVHADPDICCHSPIPLKPRAVPAVLPDGVATDGAWGGFYLQNVYDGLSGVEHGEVKWLRIIEETSRTSPSPGGGGPYNQTFLVSAALAFGVKNYLGIVPVEEDGSARFEAPAGRAIYLQALDDDMRLVQSMRTFVQATPGVTRSCIGCHEPKFGAPANIGIRAGHRREPVRPQPESWGTGHIDYASMVQPVLDRHCVECHGGEKGFAAGLDLTGGWTEHFNISYENLVSRRDNQMTATLIAGIDCMNGTAHWSARLFGPREHGSGAAPLADILAKGHGGRIPGLSRRERDLLMAWIDTNGLYYGTWDYTDGGPELGAYKETRSAVVAEMRNAGCMSCHERDGQFNFESDWINLERPELSRVLRAPLAKGGDGHGQALCLDKAVDPRRKRVRLLVNGNYAHAVQPLDRYVEEGRMPPPDGVPADPAPTFDSTDNPHYQTMLAAIRKGRRDALAAGRVDMPHAVVIAGHSRHFTPPSVPEPPPELRADLVGDGLVRLSWEATADTIGLRAEIHRGDSAGFAPTPQTRVAETEGARWVDTDAEPGGRHYAVVFASGAERSALARASVEIPAPETPPPATALAARPGFNRIRLSWRETAPMPLRYHVYRAPKGAAAFERLTGEPVPDLTYEDAAVAPDAEYLYTVRPVGRGGVEGEVAAPVSAQAPPSPRAPVLTAMFDVGFDGIGYDGSSLRGVAHGGAKIAEGALDLSQGGHVTYENRPEFGVSATLVVECEAHMIQDDRMPVVLCCGAWGGPGWFLQRLGGGWRWYVGGVVCDGGRPVRGEWTRLMGTFDGTTARLYQDGRLVGEARGKPSTASWDGPLVVGQYSAAKPEYQTTGFVRGVKIRQTAPEELHLEVAQAAGGNR